MMLNIYNIIKKIKIFYYNDINLQRVFYLEKIIALDVYRSGIVKMGSNLDSLLIELSQLKPEKDGRYHYFGRFLSFEILENSIRYLRVCQKMKEETSV